MFSTAALICSEDGLTTTGGKESNTDEAIGHLVHVVWPMVESVFDWKSSLANAQADFMSIIFLPVSWIICIFYSRFTINLDYSECVWNFGNIISVLTG